MTDDAIWWIRNSVEQHHLQFVHLPCLRDGQWGILLKSVAAFLCHLLNPITVYLGYIHVKWILNLPLKSLAKEVYMLSKLGDSTASYILNVVI